MPSKSLTVVLLCCLPVVCQAAQTRSLSVTFDDGRYSTRMQVFMAAPAAAAMQVLQDYRHLARLNPAVQKAVVLSSKGGDTLLETTLELCVAFLCKTLHQVQHMQVLGLHALQADVIPAQSDLSFGHASWRFTPTQGGTLMDFSAQIDPKFWVPPLIGPWLIRMELEEQARITSRNLERLARARQP